MTTSGFAYLVSDVDQTTKVETLNENVTFVIPGVDDGTGIKELYIYYSDNSELTRSKITFSIDATDKKKFTYTGTDKIEFVRFCYYSTIENDEAKSIDVLLNTEEKQYMTVEYVVNNGSVFIETAKDVGFTHHSSFVLVKVTKILNGDSSHYYSGVYYGTVSDVPAHIKNDQETIIAGTTANLTKYTANNFTCHVIRAYDLA
jgi:hypothetical protein